MDTQPSTQSVFRGFEGFGAPNTTPVPDIVFDVLAPDLSEAELRVLLYIIRRTFGFKKTADTISLGQMVHGIVRRDGTALDRGTGLAKSGVTKALKGLLAKGVIVARQNRSAERGNEPTTYTLRFKTPLSTGEDKGLSTGVDKPLSTGVDTQDTVVQETVLQSNSSTIEMNQVNSIKSKRNRPEHIAGDQTVAMTMSRLSRVTADRSEVVSIGEIVKQRAGQLGVRHRTSHPTKASVGPSAPPTAVDRSGDGQDDGVKSGKASSGPGGAAARLGRRMRLPLQIEAIITQFTDEFHDSEHLEVNINQAARLWHASGRSKHAFTQLLFDAASTTRKRGGVRNRMAYFFRVLRDLLGLERRPS